MEVNNRLAPDAGQMAGFMDKGHESPIYMVNLLKFRPKAEYPDGRATDLTGEQAYAIYTEGVRKLMKTVGADGMFNATVSRLTIGEVAELWDKVAVAMYPSRTAMLQMAQSPGMAEINVHRAAGLAGQLNIETINPGGAWLQGAQS